MTANQANQQVSVSFRLDKALHDSLKRVCKEKGYSQNFVVRELLKDWLSKQDKQQVLFK